MPLPIRDSIDARRNLAEFMLPVMLVVLAMSFLRVPTVLLMVTTITYTILAVAILDTLLMWRRLKAKVEEKFGEGAGKGNGMYAAMRAFQMRRTRMPRAQVQRGQTPR